MTVEENEKIPMDTISVDEFLQSIGMNEPAVKAMAKEVARAANPPATKEEGARVPE